MRSKESEDSKALEKALSQVEDNLKRCTVSILTTMSVSET